MAEVRAWLEELGLGSYAEAFEAEKIEIADLRDLAEIDLEKLGLPMGPRKRMLRAIAAFAKEHGEQTDDKASGARYAPTALAEKILSARASIEGERKQVTILFADIKGSTDLVQHLDAEEVSSLFDPLQRMMIGAVHAYEGTVNEVLGDGIMAIFGAPIAHEDHAFRACRTALDMQESVRRWVGVSAPKGAAQAIKLRVGLNSGEVVVRTVNNDLTISYSAMGMTTHLAARMEQTAEPDTIQISSDTFRLVTGLVDARSRGAIEMKGVGEPVPVYELRGLGKARTRLEVASLAGLTPFVGRQQELRLLDERLAEAEAGHGQVVAIVGDPGIGKSRLLLECRAQLGDRVAWAEGRSVSFGHTMAFHPLIDLLRRNFRVEDRDDAGEIRAKVAQGVRRIEPKLEPTLPYLFYMLGVSHADDPLRELDPQIRRVETFGALRHLLLRAAERKPQVLVFEDLHWSDNASREFVSFLIDSIPRSRAMVLLTQRPGHDFAVGERAYATHLTLRSLSEAESSELAGAVLASADLPKELHTLIQRKAEGNPFFVEEVIKALSESGGIRREDGRWVLGGSLDHIQVPDTIQDVLMSRIDRLDEEPRQALQLAAVIGREFTQRLLDRIADIRPGSLPVLRELQAIELIREKAVFPELAYMFKHALTQDVAYRSLLSQKRREVHRRIGEAIEELYLDRLAEHYAMLGYHFARGEDWLRAAAYFEKAAEGATAAFAVHEALALYDQALDALSRCADDETVSAKRADLYANKAGLYILLSDFPRVHAENAEAAAIACKLADPVREGSALAGMALASLYQHEFDRCRDEAARAMELGRSGNSNEVVAAGQWATGFLQAVTGHLVEARGNLEHAYGLASTGGDVFWHALLASDCGLLYNWQADYSAAVTIVEEGAHLARTHNLAFPLLIALFQLGLPLTGRGDYDQALSVFNEGLELADKLGEEIFRHRILNSLGWLHGECGNLERALQFNQEAIDASEERGDPETIANAKLNLGDAYRAKGDIGAAFDCFESVHGLARKGSTSEWMKWRYSQHLFVGLGEVCLASDDPRAADFCNQSLELATRTDSRKYLARAWRLKGEIARANLDWEEAEQALRKALAYAEQIGNPTQLWQTHFALAQLQRDRHRIDPARSSFAATLKVIEGISQSLSTPELNVGFKRSPLIQAVRDRCHAG